MRLRERSPSTAGWRWLASPPSTCGPTAWRCRYKCSSLCVCEHRLPLGTARQAAIAAPPASCGLTACMHADRQTDRRVVPCRSHTDPSGLTCQPGSATTTPPPIPAQVRAWICVALIVVLRLLNLAVPILYKKVRRGSLVAVAKLAGVSCHQNPKTSLCVWWSTSCVRLASSFVLFAKP